MVDAARQLEEPVIVIDPRWALPTHEDLIATCCQARCVITLEDGLVNGGVGVSLQQALNEANCAVPIVALGIGHQFLPHASRQSVLIRQHMTAEDVLDAVRTRLANK